MSDPLTEVRFWSLVGEISRRTIICSPELESRVKGYIDARGVGGLLTVQTSRHVPEDKIFVIDEGAVEAMTNELLSKPRRLY